MQFYTRDWLADGCVSMCSPATRGIWFDLLCSMHAEDGKGVLTGDLTQLARRARCTDSELSRALDELAETDTACVVDHDRLLAVDNSGEKTWNDLCEQLPRANFTTLTALCPGKVTVISRRMASEFIERENNRLRKTRQRVSR